MPSRESCRRECRKLDRCDLPKPVCRASSETLRVPRCILRSNSIRRRSCIWVKFICGKSATSHGDDRSLFSFSKPICVFLASFFGFLCTSNRTNEELCLAALTQRIRSLHWVYSSSHRLWEILEDAVHSRNRTRVVALFAHGVDPIAAMGTADLSWIYKALRNAPRQACRAIPDSAHTS